MADLKGIGTFKVGGNQADNSREQEYQICKVRGHKANPYTGVTNAVYYALTWYRCQYCGTEFTTRTTSEELERGAPVIDMATDNPDTNTNLSNPPKERQS